MNIKSVIIALVVLVVLIAGGGLVFASDFFDSSFDEASTTKSTSSNENIKELQVSATEPKSDVVQLAEDSDSADSKGKVDEDVLSSISFTLETDNFSFTPDVIEASPGQEVTVRITNVAGVHDFIIDDLNVHTDRVKESGDELEVTFTIPEDASGEYEFYCSIGNHKELGMVGILIIE